MPAGQTMLTGLPEVPTYTRRQLFQMRLRVALRRFRDAWRIFSSDSLAVLGLILIFMFAIMAVVHPILLNTVWPKSIYDPVLGFDPRVFPNPSPPTAGHLFGTDALGRDVLSMLLAATTPTFIVGLTAALVSATVGTIFSIFSAYYRGSVDFSVTNLADVFLLFPAPLLMIIIGVRFPELGPVALGSIYGLAIGASSTTIVLRAQAIKISVMPYMEAARIAGGGPLQIMTRHMLPNMLPHAALQMMIAVAGVVVADGFISFFGFSRLVSNWGTMIYDAFVYSAFLKEAPAWQALIPPAVAFTLFAMAFYLVARGLQLVADPRLRGN
ncbi:MAG: ABC transporter permease [Chloroflexi bacterium]|nr:MAG: ABC transporter permease [Chloroflexota bacterium]MBL1197279.1 ABC transporter permease [Chloroflexota bacterium]NOH14574.1 ABC transporter permease [Chloroflexota bacterium]